MTAAPGIQAARSPAAAYRFGLVLVTLSAVAWSTAGYFSRAVPQDSWTILFWRGLFGTLTALVFIVWQERGGTWRSFMAMGKPGLVFVALSTGGMAAFLAALKLTTVAHVAIIYATAPFAAALLARLVLREKAAAMTLVASAIALAGVAVTVAGGIGEGSLLGDLLAMAMTLVMAALAVISRRYAGTPLVPAACLSSALSSVVALPFATPLAISAGDFGNLALFGISNMGIGFILFIIGARFIPAAQSALIGALETPLAPLWVWLAFGETPGAATLAGGAIVVAAVVANIVSTARTGG